MILAPTISRIIVPAATVDGPGILYVGPFRDPCFSADETAVRHKMDCAVTITALHAVLEGQQPPFVEGQTFEDGRLDIIVRNQDQDTTVIITHAAGEWGGLFFDTAHEAWYNVHDSYAIKLVNYAMQPSIAITQLSAHARE